MSITAQSAKCTLATLVSYCNCEANFSNAVAEHHNRSTWGRWELLQRKLRRLRGCTHTLFVSASEVW